MKNLKMFEAYNSGSDSGIYVAMGWDESKMEIKKKFLDSIGTLYLADLELLSSEEVRMMVEKGDPVVFYGYEFASPQVKRAIESLPSVTTVDLEFFTDRDFD